MKTSAATLFHTLIHSVKFPARSSVPVAPWPPLQTPFDAWFSAELDALRSPSGARWLLRAFDLALTSQKTALKSFTTDIIFREDDRRVIEDHLEEVIELIDTTNVMREMIENVRSYVGMVKIVLHWLEGNSKPSKAGLTRARDMLNKCEETERTFSEALKRSSSSGKKQVRARSNEAKPSSFGTDMSEGTSELYEALNGSKAITLLACGALRSALSMKPKRAGLLLKTKSFDRTTSWSIPLQELQKEMKDEVEKGGKLSIDGGLVLNEFRDIVMAVKGLRNLLGGSRRENEDRERELKVNVEELRRSLEGIEDEIVEPLESRMNELYRELISVRMGLLGILSQTCLN